MYEKTLESLFFSFSLYTLIALGLFALVGFYLFHKYRHNKKVLQWVEGGFGLMAAISLLAVLYNAKVMINQYGSLAFNWLFYAHFVPPMFLLAKIFKINELSRSEKDYQNYAEEGHLSHKEIRHLNWDQVVVAQQIREELMVIVTLLKASHKVSRDYGIELPKGILLAGPPGNGKTTLAKIMASQAGVNFFTITNDLLISKWVGQSEKYLTRVFEEAQRQKPAIIFIDEIDSIARKRSEASERWAENLLNHLLQLMDGIFQLEGVYVIGATNRPELIDPALKRAGRLSKEVVIPQPDLEARKALFALYLSKLPLAGGVNTGLLAEKSEGFSCADISSLCNQAGLNAYRRDTAEGVKNAKVLPMDIVSAMNKKIDEMNGNDSSGV